MSDEIDTDMIEDCLIVIDLACTDFKASVLTRATREMDWQARHKADDVIVSFDAVTYAGQRGSEDLMLLELDQLCQKLTSMLEWSIVNRPFDCGPYEAALDAVELAQGAIYSALGIYRKCHKILPRIPLKT